MNEEILNEIKMEELTEEQIKEVQAIFKRFIQKYKENQDKESIEWLVEQLKEELPDKSDEEIQKLAEEIVEAIEEYDEDLADLNRNCEEGTTKQSWFAEKIQDAAKGVAIKQFGDSLHQIDLELEGATDALQRALQEDSCNIQVNGILLRRHHICDFNVKASMAGSPYRAILCPLPQSPEYGDVGCGIAIGNIDTKELVDKYQVISNSDIRDTILGTEVFDVGIERLVVPKEQVQGVQNAFPNKKVTSYIGGEEYGVQSEGIDSTQIKSEQVAFEEKGESPSIDWNVYKTKELVKGIGQCAGHAGIQAALLGAGVGIAYKAFKGEKVEVDEVVETALVTGADAGVKCAAAGALTVAVRKGILSIIPPGTPAGTLAKIASVGIENVKILWKVAKGDLQMSQALEQMGRTSTAMYAGLTASAVGAGIGIAAFGWIPVVGPIVGGVVGGMVGYMAGSKFGEKVFEGAKKVYQKGKEIVKKGVEKIKSAGRAIFNGVRRFLHV